MRTARDRDFGPSARACCIGAIRTETPRALTKTKALAELLDVLLAGLLSSAYGLG